MSSAAWHSLFYSPNEPRLRAGWRLVIQLLLLGFMLVLELFVFALINAFVHWHFPDTSLLIISTLMELLAFTGSVALARRWLDKRSFASLGLRVDKDPISDLCSGFILAALMLGGVFMTMQRLGWLQVTNLSGPHQVAMDWHALIQMGLYLLIFVVVGFQEELLCRGYHLQTIASGWNVFFAVIGSSVIFAGLHSLNPGFNWMGFLGIFCAGLLLAFAAVRTGRLWLSIGIHIGWNFFEAVVFGFPTSGVVTFSLTHIHVTGPVLWTGGVFGPEAGLIILPALAIGAALVWAFTK
jgi:membrane protease YdiL (CAAX protease family)